MGLFMSPVESRLVLMCPRDLLGFRTLPILKLLLDDRIVDVGIDLVLLQSLLQSSDDVLSLDPTLLSRLAFPDSIACRLQRIYPLAYPLDFLDLLCAVCGEDLSRFLETLIWQLSERYLR